MTLFGLLWVGLVLGGLIASLWYQESWHVRAFRRPSRVAVPEPDDSQARPSPAAPPGPVWARGDFMPPPQVATRPGPPPPGRSAG